MDDYITASIFYCMVTVDFHHIRGPEIEHVFPQSIELPKEWSILPFLCLPDGAHMQEKDFVYFTLPYPNPQHSTAFGLACSRQLSIDHVKNLPSDVTRPSIQKAVVLICSTPQFGHIKDNLEIVTDAYFSQNDFSDLTILHDFYKSLVNKGPQLQVSLGVNSKDVFLCWKQNTLVLLKLVLLGKKVLVYDRVAERLGNLQYSLLSLIPNMLLSLHDSADPSSNYLKSTLSKPSSLKTSDKDSLMAYLGFPLLLFGEKSMFSPYTPLQQVHVLESSSTKSWLAGSTNTLIMLNQNRMADVVVRADTGEICYKDNSIKSIVNLTRADKRWTDDILSVISTHEEKSLPEYEGSNEWLRARFEAYIFGFLSTVKYYSFLHSRDEGELQKYNSLPSTDCISDYGQPFLDEWMKTATYSAWNPIADDDMFDVVLAQHPYCQTRPQKLSTRLSGFLSSIRNSQINKSSTIETPDTSSSTSSHHH
ncbi:post-Golgi vesicle-mediated transport protein Avl9 [Schizosaccharomyces osmophilus]|uniref:Post-Golgi vesicle-mediated transport protein Avl9 n=1 Tax=Schizosaccharomyces osmophilus TaxID=2545709 RepID=A0AAE9WDH7_9SCHI|nr:post-Golgi vesicle-mediated transport protein Avl9 [Schizosaccharomyces osmophilus]WBW73584.1 post-Golgi vesicle-mediated transport protein Avl9 [Schizosaccharomyces osmophilus]